MVAGLPVVAQGQTSVTMDAIVASSFVWRGVHFTNRPVTQADAYVTHVRGDVAFTGGVWVNAEPAHYAGTASVRMLAAGHRGPALTAIAPWIDATLTRGPLALTGGATIYRYPQRTGFAEAFNTTELYAKAALDTRLAPRVQVWYDVAQVQGAYVEAGVAQPFTLGREFSAGLTAGWSAGMENVPGQTWYFAEPGLAAVDATLSSGFTWGEVTVTPTLHTVYARDPAARLIGPETPLRTVKTWWTLAASWTP